MSCLTLPSAKVARSSGLIFKPAPSATTRIRNGVVAGKLVLAVTVMDVVLLLMDPLRVVDAAFVKWSAMLTLPVRTLR